MRLFIMMRYLIIMLVTVWTLLAAIGWLVWKYPLPVLIVCAAVYGLLHLFARRRHRHLSYEKQEQSEAPLLSPLDPS